MLPAYKKIISENDSKYFHRKKTGLQNCMIKQNSVEWKLLAEHFSYQIWPREISPVWESSIMKITPNENFPCINCLLRLPQLETALFSL